MPDAAPRSARRELLVLGMHHSGTSIVTKLLGSAGAYLGAAQDMVWSAHSPLKFYERRDVVDANQNLLRSSGGCTGTTVGAEESATANSGVSSRPNWAVE